MQLKWPMRWDLFSLFPAYAGVILSIIMRIASLTSFPRIRGGDPVAKCYAWVGENFSPHTRG